MKKIFYCFLFLLLPTPYSLLPVVYAGSSLHYVNHWHDHQPIYWPNKTRASAANRYEYGNETINNKNNSPFAGHSSVDVFGVFNIDDRKAAYQYRCKDALGTIGGYPEAGFTISYTGALAENVKSLGDAYALGYSPGWNNPWKEARGWTTSGGKTRMDILLTGFHHQFFPLLPDDTLARRIIQLYKQGYPEWWGTAVPQSTGFWPMELAFSERMIPSLLAEGVTWTYVPNTHISRCMPNWPATPGNGMNTEPPNKADQYNPNGAAGWRNASQDGRPTTNDLREAYRPHYAKYINPDTGATSKIIAVPAADYEGYIDGYQSYDVGLFDAIAGAQDGSRPALVVLAHDGDNAWGGGNDSYMTNTPQKASGASAKGYTPSQTSQYLADHPIPVNDIWHVEDGPWVNAAGDFGSPTFSNWNWPWKKDNLPNRPTFDSTTWDDNSQFWAIMIAGTNRILTAESYVGAPNIANVLHPDQTTPSNIDLAWHYWLAGFDSGHVYYGTAEDFSWIPIIAMNNAMPYCDAIIGSGEITGADTVSPTVWIPQRFPYNPGSLNYGCPYNYKSFIYPSEFDVYSFVYDASGLSSVKLKWRTATGVNTTPIEPDNFTYTGGTGVTSWNEVVMSTEAWPLKVMLNGTEQIPPPLTPNYLPTRCWAHLSPGANKLVDYYIEATDKKGNVRKTAIQHVWVGDGSGASGGGGTQLWTPTSPTTDQQVTIYGSVLSKPGKLHWGVNSWTQPSSQYWPSNSTTTVYDTQSVETQMLFNGTSYYITLGPFLGSQSVNQINFVFHWDDGTWDNNGGANWTITISPVDNTPPPAPTRLTPTAKNEQIDLSWEQVTGVTLSGYNIYQWDVNNSTYVKLSSLITWTTGYAVTISTPSNTTLVNGTTYQYSVTAVKSAGLNPESSFSTSVTTSPVATDNISPATPLNFYAVGGVGSVTLYWTKNLETDLANYKLYVSTYPCNFSLKTATATPAAAQTSYSNTGLTPLTTYFYQFTAIDNSAPPNESPPTNETFALTQSVPPPSAPTGLTATAGNQKVNLKWNPNSESNLAGYNLYCSSVGVYYKVNNSLISSATTYSHTSLTNGATYYYKLTAVNTSAGESNYSSEVSAKPMDSVPVVLYADMRGIPNVTSVVIAQNYLAPTWSATYYAMVQQTGDLLGVYKTTLNIPAGVSLQYKYVMNGATWESDFGTAPNNNRQITIQTNNGSYMYVSNKWNIAGDAQPTIPQSLQATGQFPNSIKLNWSAISDFDLQGYNIYRSTWSANINYLLIASTVSGTIYTDSGLTPTDTYYYKIDSQDLAGQKSGICGPAAAIAGYDSSPAQVTGLSATAKDTAVELRWSANSESDLAGYYVYKSSASGGPYSSTSTLISPTTTFYTWDSLTNGTSYFFIVRASDTVGNLSTLSSEVWAIPTDVSFEERTIDGNFLDWKFSDVRALDASEDTYIFNDGYDSARDIVALYSREGQNNYYFRVDFHELGLYAEDSYLNLYLAIDCASGGQIWLPDYVDCQTDKPWEICVALYNATSASIFKADWTTVNTAFQGAKFNSQYDSVELAISKDALTSYGWTPGTPIGIQVFSTKDGTNGGTGEIANASDITDAIEDDNRGYSDGILNGNTLSTSSTGRAKYGFIYHGNQSLNLANDIRNWIYTTYTDHTPTGYRRGLDTIENYKIKGNIHVSGTLASAIQWADITFNQRIANLTAAGQTAVVGGVLAEHMMPYFEDTGGFNPNSRAIKDGTDLLKHIYNLSATPKVFWTPERVIRGTTFGDILTNHDTNQPTGYTAIVLDDKYHLRNWFAMPDSQRFKLHKINGVYVFLINGVRADSEAAPSEANQLTYGYYDPDGAKFWNQDGGLHIGTRKLLLEKAQDSDQQQLVLVFDDWEAYAGRSFTSALPNDNADNWDKTIGWIANHQWIETVTLENILTKPEWTTTAIDHGTNTTLPVVTYDWLMHASENSYDNWYNGTSLEESFANRIPKVKGTTQLPSNKKYGNLSTAGTIIRDIWNDVKVATATQLSSLAGMVYNTMNYETAWHDEDNSDKFSSADTTYDNISGWAVYLHGHIRHSSIIAKAALWANAVSTGGISATTVAQSVDLDSDGEAEYVLSNNKVYCVFERYGGRLVMGFAYEPTVGGIQLIGAPATNYDNEGEEESTRHISAFRDSNYENDNYSVSVWTSSVTFTSSDGKIKKIISLPNNSETLTANYSQTLGTNLYLKFGLSPNVYDMYFDGKQNILDISSTTYIGLKNSSGGSVYLTFGQTTHNTGYSDGTSDNTNAAHTRVFEVFGGSEFTVSLTLSGTGAVDLTPPSAITNLLATTGSNDGEINLSWTAPGDDGTAGNNTADAKYELKFATYGVVGGNIESWYSASATYPQNWTVANRGVTENKTLTGLNRATPYFVGIKTIDDANNKSGITIVASAYTPSDTIPPSAITTLSALTGDNSGEIKLSWLAPGNDGTAGTAVSYDIRYSTNISQSPAISTNTFYNSGSVSSPPVPSVSGTPEIFTLTGLIYGSTYYFAIISKDTNNYSQLSNGATAVAKPDTVPPDAITTLSALTGITAGTVQLQWTSTGDDGTVGQVVSGKWRVDYSTQSNYQFQLDNYKLEISTSYSPLTTRYSLLTGLTEGDTYYIRLWARDDGTQWSSISNAATAQAKVDDIAPSVITDLTGFTGSTSGAVQLQWTSPGDDGWVGNLTGQFEIRYSTDPNLSISQSLNLSTSSVIPLTTRYSTLTGLTEGSTYYFAIRTADDKNNYSSLSGGTTIQVDHTPPAGISDLTTLTGTLEGEIVLKWTAPGDDGTVRTVSGYLVKYATAPITATSFSASWVNTNWPNWTNWLVGGSGEIRTLTGLIPTATYYFALKSYDDKNNYSVWNSSYDVSGINTLCRASVQSIIPAAITNLSALSGTEAGSVKITWTAPCEDGTYGTAVASYEIRYATYSFSEAEFSQTTYLTYPPSPTTPGTSQSITIINLTQGAEYYFRIKSKDESGNISPIDTTTPSANAIATTGQQLPKPPIYIAFQWHMHQPIYYPYETAPQTDDNGRYSFSVVDTHNSRTGPYTSWPKNAVAKGIDAGLKHLGAQVSFSGSLSENITNIVSAGRGFWAGWQNDYKWANTQLTQAESSTPPGASGPGGNNPRLDLIGFGYHHPLMGLVSPSDIRKQLQLHKQQASNVFGITNYSKGIFPPENAFRPEMIPALIDEGIQWAIVDNIHFDRAVNGYPWSSGGNLVEPNPSDQINNPSGVTWLQLNNLWAGTKVSVPWGYKPHYVQYTDPESGVAKKIIAVPGARYEGNEDARGGFGALQYESVMSQYEAYNTDPAHPMIVVLPHDGDNYGGGTESYYNSNFQNFVNWLLANPSRFVCTTIQDYLDMFPPDPNDVINVENGSWSGADNGDPEFLKWNGDPTNSYSPDRNSWGIVTAAKNRLDTAESILPAASITDILNNTGNNTAKAWHYYYNGQTSCYWYWDGTEIWDSNPARACNLAVSFADQVLGTTPADAISPTIYIPQREPYNPGGTEWGIVKTSTFTVWTYIYDLSGLSSVNLKYRVDADGVRDSANNLYSGGTWNSLTMPGATEPSNTNPQPMYKAQKFSADITGQSNKLLDYYVEAVDTKGNIAKSPLIHVWVGQATTPGQTTLWQPSNPTKNDTITVNASQTKPGKLHWGVNNWTLPNTAYWPSGTVAYGDGKSVETPLLLSGSSYYIQIGPFNNDAQTATEVNFVFHWDDGAWDNNGGLNWKIPVDNTVLSTPTVNITYPANNSSVSGSTVNVTASATDDVGVTRVEFYYKISTDTVWTVISTVTVSPYSIFWNTLSLAEDKLYNLKALAFDADGNYGTSPEVTVRVNNINLAPTITIGAPNGGETLSGSTNITWFTNDTDGDTLLITLQQSTQTASGTNWTNIIVGMNNLGSYSWNTTLVSDATNYLIRAIVSDPGGLTGLDTSDGIFRIRNTDTESPSAVTNLSALPGQYGGQIQLTWTSPGDDGTVGNLIQNSKFRIQHSTYTVSWSTANAQINISTSTTANTIQMYSIGSLTPGDTYYFRIWTNDEAGNYSAISNAATSYANTGPQEAGPPGAITNLIATSGDTTTENDYGKVTLTWTAPPEDGTYGTAVSYYIVKYRTDAAITDSNWATATDVTGEPTPATPGTTQTFIVSILTAGQNYYWGIKSVDDANNTSSIDTSSPRPSANAGVTYHNVNSIDGNISDWSATAELMDNDNRNGGNKSLYITWSSTAVYFAYGNNTFNDMDLFILIDTHTSYDIAIGTKNPPGDWDGMPQHTLPFYADYCLSVEGSGWKTLDRWNGTAWVNDGNGANIYASSINDATAGGNSEIAILRSALSNPMQLRVCAVHKWDTQKNIFASFPIENPAPNTDTANTFTHFYVLNLTDGQSPSAAQVVTSADAIPPDAITTLSALPGDNSGEIKLSWTATGDDGTIGNVSGGKWRIAYSTEPNYNFQITNYKLQISTSYSPLATCYSLLANLTPGDTYYFRLWAYDDVGNFSDISNAATTYAKPAGPPASSFTATIDGIKDSSWGGTPNSTSVNYKLPADYSRDVYITNDQAYLYIGFQFKGDPWDDTKSAHYNFLLGTGTTSGTATDPWKTTTSVSWTDKPDVAVNGWVSGITANSLGGMLRYVSDGTNWDAGTSLVSGTDFASSKTNDWAEFRIPLNILKVQPGSCINIIHLFRPDESKLGVSDSTPFDSIGCNDYGNANSTLSSSFTYTLQGVGDSTSPSAITTLFATQGNKAGVLQLQWQSTGDDDLTGNITLGKFRLKISTDSGYSFNHNDYTVELTTNTSPLAENNYCLAGLTDGTTYYCRLWIADEVPNWSAISNAATTWVQVDVTSPSAITTLSASPGDSESKIILMWISPGDDGTVGTATSFDIRYSTITTDSPAVNLTKFLSANSVSDFSPIPSPPISGSNQSLTITGLDSSKTYYFAMRSSDERGNSSGISNGATSWAQMDNIAPLQITDLSAQTASSEGRILLSWTATGDDGTVGNVVDGKWRLAYSTNPAYQFQITDYKLQISTSYLPLTTYHLPLTNLTPGDTYFIRLWASDEQTEYKPYYWSAISNAATTWAQVDVTEPAAISDFSGVSGYNKVILTWTSPGDDGTIGIIANGKYQIKYSSVPIDTWESPVYDLEFSTSTSANVSQSKVITGLVGNTSWYFWIKIRDELNWSELSNKATFWVEEIPITATYLDIAPEPSPAKQSLGINEYLYAGDGNTIYSPAPIGMLKIRLKTPANETVQWTGLKIYTSSLTTVAESSVTAIGLYKDADEDDNFDGEITLGGLSVDTFISSTTLSGGVAQFVFGTPQTIDSNETKYFITVRIAIPIMPGTTLGFELRDPSDFTMTGVITSTESAKSCDSNILSPPPIVYYNATDIAGWVNGQQVSQVKQGEPAVGMLKLGLWKDPPFYYTPVWQKLRVDCTGMFPGNSKTDIAGIKIYKDGNSNETFEPGDDTSISTEIQFSTFTATYIDIDDQEITSTTQYYFISYRIGTDAIVGDELGLKIPTDGMFIYSGELGSHFAAISSYVTVEEDIILPAAISDLIALTGNDDGQIVLQWTSPGDDGNTGMLPTGSQFRIKYSSVAIITSANYDSSIPPRYTINIDTAGINPATTCNYVVTGLVPGSSYWFAIKTKDETATNWSVWNSSHDANVNTIAYCSTQDLTPQMPQNLTSLAGDTQTQLSWTANTDMDLYSYRIYRDSWNFTNSFVLYSSTPSNYTVFLDTGLTNGNRYWYKITALDKTGHESAYSTIVNTTPYTTPPITPSNFHLTSVGVSSICWQFTDNADNETELYISSGPNITMRISPNLENGSYIGTMSWIETNLSTNTQYTRYAEATNIYGSNWSALVSTYTLANPPLNSSVVSVSSWSIQIQWSANGNPSYTRWGILRSTESGFTSAATLTSFDSNQTATTYVAGGLQSATTYWFKVQAFNEDGVATAYDTTISTKTKSDDIIPPKPPVGVKGVVSDGKLKNISWSEVGKNSDGTNCDDLSNYKLYYSSSLEGPWVFMKTVSSATRTIDITVTANYYKITAVDSNDNESADSIYIDNSASVSAVSKENGKIVASVKIPQDVSDILYKEGKYADDIVINLQKLPESDEKDICVYEFSPEKSKTGEKIDDFKFVQQKAEITFFYDLNNDGYIEKIGIPNSEAKNWLSIFYYNSVEWEKLGGSVSESAKSITIKTSHLSQYKLRKSLRTIGFGDLRMYPKKIFAPKDTVWNKMRFVYENDADKRVSLKIFDMKGRLVYENSTTGTEIYWDGKDENDNSVSGGVYIYQIECDKKVINGTVMVVK